MIQKLMQKRREEEGFTLIELLIVIIILGILAAVVIFGVSAFREDSVSKACKTDMKSVETAAQAYIAKNGSAAGSLSALSPTYLRTAPNEVSTVGDYYVTYTPTGGNATADPPVPPSDFTVTGKKKGGADC